MIRAIAEWLHRLHCVAYAFRGANSRLTLVSGQTLILAGCHTCHTARVCTRTATYREGDIVTMQAASQRDAVDRERFRAGLAL